MIGLGIDAGGSSTRWLLHDADRELARGQLGPLTGHLFDAERRAEAAARLHELAAAALAHARPDAAVAGITGLDSRGPEHAFLTETLADALSLPTQAVWVMHDTPLAYRSTFAPGEGVLLYAGTGSIAFHLRPDGGELRAGGHGYIIDDAGAGYFLGRRALRSIVRGRDERGSDEHPSLLEEAICDRVGGRSWDELRAYVYGGGVSAVAALAPAVAAAAELGDEIAGQILAEAGAELARLARVLVTRLGKPLPVGFAGGVSRLGGALERALREALPPGVRLFLVREEPVMAAARLALTLDEAAGPR
jgi:N-acetylglucosamine kinase-like BadF-type ATPase